MTDSLFSWTTLLTLSGAAMITFLIVLYTGRIIDGCKYWKWGTDLYAALWAFIILSIANAANGGDYTDWKLYCLAFFNSFLVAAAAGKLRDKSIDEVERKKDTSGKKIKLNETAEHKLQEGQVELLIRLLSKRYGSLSEDIIKQIEKLDIKALNSLAEDIFDFESMGDLKIWLKKDIED